MNLSIARLFRPQDSEDSKSGLAGIRSSILSSATSIILMLTTAIAVFFLVLVTKENDRLKTEAAQFNGALAGPPTAQVGDILLPFNSVDLEDQQARLAYNGTVKHLLFIFSPRCSVCLSQIPVWNNLTIQAKSKNIKVLGLSLDSGEAAKSYLRDVKLDFDVVAMPNKAIQRAYRTVSLPQVVLVSPNGIVEWVHYGELSESVALDLRSKIESR
jgi:peroxiredoxin